MLVSKISLAHDFYCNPSQRLESGCAQEGAHPQILSNMEEERMLHPNLPLREVPHPHGIATWKITPVASG